MRSCMLDAATLSDESFVKCADGPSCNIGVCHATQKARNGSGCEEHWFSWTSEAGPARHCWDWGAVQGLAPRCTTARQTPQCCRIILSKTRAWQGQWFCKINISRYRTYCQALIFNTGLIFISPKCRYVLQPNTAGKTNIVTCVK